MTTITRSASTRRPGTITIARLLLGLTAAGHLVIPIIMLARRPELEAEIQQRHQAFSASEVVRSAAVAIDAAIAFHLILTVMCVALVVGLAGRHGWVLRVAIVSQVAGIAFSAVSWNQSSMFHGLIPVMDVVALAIIVCLVIERRTRGRGPIAQP